jgi:hypothetical protein
VLLVKPHWERRLLRLLEESGVGRIMESGEDENEIQLARMNGCIAWEHEESEGAVNLLRSFCFGISSSSTSHFPSIVYI